MQGKFDAIHPTRQAKWRAIEEQYGSPIQEVIASLVGLIAKKQVAEALGCDRGTLRDWCITLGMPPKRMTVSERFWAKTQKLDSGCWIWLGAKDGLGYGLFGIPNADKERWETISAHRYAYQEVNGLIPSGLKIDHLCRNPSCVNPSHLEPVTNRENIIRGFIALGIRRDIGLKCANGHGITEQNHRRKKNGQIVCAVCENQRRKKYGCYNRRKQAHGQESGD